METNYKNAASVTFPSDPKNLRIAESLIDDVCHAHNIHEDHYGNILIAVTEAVNNAIFHGNLNDVQKSVSVDSKIENNQLQFIISDSGLGFDYHNLPDPTAPENIEKETGRGIFLMKSLADKVEFKNNGAKVLLTFTIGK
ncbi:ATP-binding protein [Brumimicrobium salinarum]|uniref:ATP-binding protein n=1 Tax=Brumimicrobium salinarum TaxID=2058658 RepID=A0A2I0R689_9FLAO|nr:ATP-binding protein [Brumimicrobium salinarum]PKR82101.1 ATP-binding protein [Brumimicrobium salinarum]